MSAGMEGGKEINGEDEQAQEGKEDQKKIKNATGGKREQVVKKLKKNNQEIKKR